MQMLTRSGWSPSNDIEVCFENNYKQKSTKKFVTVSPSLIPICPPPLYNSLSLSLSHTHTQSILVQIRAEIMSDPNTRLEATGRDTDYSEHEARASFERMVMKYGWKR